MATPNIPDKLINYNVYVENNVLAGVADVTLPSFEALSETIKGAGIAGEIELGTIGHFGKMSTEFTFRTITSAAVALAAQKIHAIELRGAQQVMNTSEGVLSAEPVKVVLRCTPKKVDLGKLAVASVTDTKVEFEVIYIKILVNGEEIVELDKLNSIYKVNGTDYMTSIREALGL